MQLKKLLTQLGGYFSVQNLKSRLEELNQQTKDPSLWNNPQKAQTILKEKKSVTSTINAYNHVIDTFNDCVELSNIATNDNDIQLINTLAEEWQKLLTQASKLQVEFLFTDLNDSNDCFLDINAGAGGTESYDWAAMMLRMYIRFAETMNFKTKIVHLLDCEDAGIKSCTVKIQGYNAYGWLKTESGVHRLVRISPFNSLGKRMTSFASAWAYPVINDNIEVNIQDKDLRIDTYRASGAGGQHVNTTDSAVRITHVPTGIVVQCQNDRSQHKNKSEALRMLKAKIYELEQKKQNEVFHQQNISKPDNSWGHQIRSYILQPYQLVKDLRTNVETTDAQGVLDGNLEKFVYASLIDLAGKNKL